jgi:hypothetical protein
MRGKRLSISRIMIKPPRIFPKSRRQRERGLMPYSIILKGSIMGTGRKRPLNQPLTPLPIKPAASTRIMEISARAAATLISRAGGFISKSGSK